MGRAAYCGPPPSAAARRTHRSTAPRWRSTSARAARRTSAGARCRRPTSCARCDRQARSGPRTCARPAGSADLPGVRLDLVDERHQLAFDLGLARPAPGIRRPSSSSAIAGGSRSPPRGTTTTKFAACPSAIDAGVEALDRADLQPRLARCGKVAGERADRARAPLAGVEIDEPRAQRPQRLETTAPSRADTSAPWSGKSRASGVQWRSCHQPHPPPSNATSASAPSARARQPMVFRFLPTNRDPRKPPCSALDMEHADQGEQAPCGGMIGFDLSLEPFEQQVGGIVVDRAPRHVDRLDLGRGRLADRLVIAVADREIVADRAAEPREAQHQRFERGHRPSGDRQRQPSRPAPPVAGRTVRRVQPPPRGSA